MGAFAIFLIVLSLLVIAANTGKKQEISDIEKQKIALEMRIMRAKNNIPEPEQSEWGSIIAWSVFGVIVFVIVLFVVISIT